MPRPPRLDRVIAFAHKLASDLEGLYREVAGMRSQLMSIVTEFDELEPLVASISSKSRCIGNGQCYSYLVLRVRRANADFLEGMILDVHVTRVPEIGDLVVRLVGARNVYAEWVRATERLLRVLEETPKLLEEYRRLVSPKISAGW
ncbi:MAG TPA: hypothetical protein EYP33_03425 [Pyrodictium sp.]|nr:hypothetical protein [Pyrodictium sp.]